MGSQVTESVTPNDEMAENYDVIASWFLTDWHEAPRDQVAGFMQRIWEEHSPPVNKVLELCYGPGLTLRELVRRGYGVTGLDASPTQLELAKQRLGRSAQVRLVEAGLPAIPLEEQFDAVVCAGGAFTYVPNSTVLLQAFQAVHRVLRPGGTFIFDLFSEALMQRCFEYTEDAPRGINLESRGLTFFLACHRPAAKDSYDLTFVQFLRNDATQTYTRSSAVHRVHTRPQERVTDLAVQAGFRRVQVFDNYRHQPSGPETLYETYVAVKPGGPPARPEASSGRAAHPPRP
ncbi:class I SAM-dependent DNA methyltransferase [Streptomyces johnsoniae]|uniref:Class I SAM-dependent methyltransferase n=1 Tax=Streptomyces johnsoniae TaxID=3075532 RepID=A0ABU2SBN9_9ACTN|nr:class I SAM-dependent methyltransferase [Streptomyces sp. DSM 41886]MDT0446393.1 class I SAM-dependent methyltransferase [Streptomyces sp. DSM 41886]